MRRSSSWKDIKEVAMMNQQLQTNGDGQQPNAMRSPSSKPAYSDSASTNQAANVRSCVSFPSHRYNWHAHE